MCELITYYFHDRYSTINSQASQLVLVSTLMHVSKFDPPPPWSVFAPPSSAISSFSLTSIRTKSPFFSARSSFAFFCMPLYPVESICNLRILISHLYEVLARCPAGVTTKITYFSLFERNVRFLYSFYTSTQHLK